jgi:hypothetical protein
MADSGRPASAATHRETPPPDAGVSAIRREVLMAAHEGSEHAERAEQRRIGEATLEQFRADVRRLSTEWMTGEPLPMFREMRRVRDRILEARERRQWPRDASELYLMAGCLNALMAAAAVNLGVPEGAEEFIRSGWAYATTIDHHPLMGCLRMGGAYAAYWSGRLEQSADLARDGLEFLTEGENAARLHLYAGLAAARLGDAEGARRAVAAARDAAEHDHRDELLEIGGQFAFSRAAQAYYAGFALSVAGSGEAVAELERATELYRAGPGPGEYPSRRCRMLAHTELAIARLRSGALDAAIAALEPVMALRPGERTAVQVKRLADLREELAGAIFRGSAQAQELEEQIEDFTRQAAISGLPAAVSEGETGGRLTSVGGPAGSWSRCGHHEEDR